MWRGQTNCSLRNKIHHFTPAEFPLRTLHTVSRFCTYLHAGNLLYRAGTMYLSETVSVCISLGCLMLAVTETFYDVGSTSQFRNLVITMKSFYLSRSNSHEGHPSPKSIARQARAVTLAPVDAQCSLWFLSSSCSMVTCAQV